MKPFLLAPLFQLAIGLPVAHQGKSIGTIKEIHRAIPTNRAYALVQPHDLLHHTRRLPLDELTELTP